MALEITARPGSRSRVIVYSNTPRKKQFPNLNRMQRRSLLYKNSMSFLLDKIAKLRYEMIGSGIKIPKMPRFKNPKFLSGYYSQLLKLALEE